MPAPRLVPRMPRRAMPGKGPKLGPDWLGFRAGLVGLLVRAKRTVVISSGGEVTIPLKG